MVSFMFNDGTRAPPQGIQNIEDTRALFMPKNSDIGRLVFHTQTDWNKLVVEDKQGIEIGRIVATAVTGLNVKIESQFIPPKAKEKLLKFVNVNK